MNNAYPKYRESGIEWVGAIPATWSVTPMFAAADTVKAKNSMLAETNLLSLSFGRIIRKDIDANEGLLPETFESYQIVERNDIVFRFTDLQNDKRSLRSALVGERGIITSAYLAITPRAHESAYLAYLSRAYDAQKVYYAMGGGLRQSMKFDDVRRLPLVCPPLDEQRQIAEYLDRETGKIDELITKQQQLVATLTERRSAVIFQAVTRGLDRSVQTRDTGIRWIGRAPAAWNFVPLKWRARLQTGSTPKCAEPFADDGVQWLRPEDLNVSGHPSISNRSLSTDGAAELRSSRAGSTLICGIGATLGKAGIITVKSFSNQQITAVDSVLNDRFIFHVLTAAKLAIVALSVGNTLPIINNDRLGTLPVPVPPSKEQAEIANFVDQAISGIDLILKKSETLIETLRERRAALISAAVTGKIDVRGL